MTPSQGCAGGRGRSRRIKGLVASGIVLAIVTSRSVEACHIHHQAKPTESAASPHTPAHVTHPIHEIMKPLEAQTKAEPQVISPTSMTTAAVTPIPTSAATSTPTPATWHHSTTVACTPPAPSSHSSTSSPTAEAQVVGSTPPVLHPPAVYYNGIAPTPAPEPSTIVSAVVLVGALAWRHRRATRD